MLRNYPTRSTGAATIPLTHLKAEKIAEKDSVRTERRHDDKLTPAKSASELEVNFSLFINKLTENTGPLTAC